ncbi:lantibiotic dehydratase [Microbacterium lacticum]|uniref:Lantibiotic biosynthesis dehydratase-like protein n=1 Tax=Microbacterium lacticum TaxID=33885 RepID=A0A4Y3UN73_9MICO|nr:lantibiotic dehydratase [Microbacterium lacticum]TQM90233.1 lantibiotic biosynthesis dehydratase-like protein [Microbacterium lacticum]GEB95167.1 hypothetical protein MLA01_13860 [Microbacterium lacticum]GGN21952.1 hypothetical protein GCM10009724_15250 [Microbacterium lacticum]
MPESATVAETTTIPLPGAEHWRLWPRFVLRGTGFPAEWSRDLTTDRLAEALDTTARGIDALDEQRQHLVRTMLDGPLLSKKGQRVLKAVRAGRVPLPVTDEPWSDDLAAFADAAATAADAEARLAAVFDEEAAKIAAALEHHASDPRFQAAVRWQNPELGAFLAERQDATQRNVKGRQRLNVIARYLQRYTLKNDSIGYFGSHRWGLIDSGDAEELRLVPGPLVEERTTYLEQWCFDDIADLVAESSDVRAWLPARRRPEVAFDGERVRVSGKLLSLPASRLASIGTVLAACDGERAIPALAAAMPEGSRLSDPQTLRPLLEAMERAGLITWTLRQPLDMHPGQRLLSVIERFAPAEVRERFGGLCRDLETLRRALASAPEEPDSVSENMGRLAATFERATGLSASRSHGATYAGRTLAYEDCRRGGDLQIGGGFLERHGAALGLVLDSSRWLAAEYARRLSHRIDALVLKLRSSHDVVDLAVLWESVVPIFFGRDRSMIEEVRSEMHRRWLKVFGDLSADAEEVRFRSDELADAVAAVFDAEGPGWASGRYQSPDITVGMRPDGTSYAVLGEAHVGCNTTRNNLFTQTLDAPSWSAARFVEDVPEPTVRPTFPHQLMSTPRLDIGVASEKSLLAVFGEESTWDLGSPTAFAAADAVVGEGDERHLAVLPDGRRVPLLDVFAESIAFVVAPSFTMLPPRAYWPRVVIDDLVVSRRRWSLDAAEVSALSRTPGGGESDRLLRLAVWRRGLGLPQRVFVKAPTEDKPFYLDFASPELVALFLKSATASSERNAGRITVTELLPAHDDLWLTDSEQHGHFTSEFRIVAVDQRPYRPNHA